MSEKGLKVAIKYGKNLRDFEGVIEAEMFFLKFKDELLKQLELFSKESDIFKVDYKIESLKSWKNGILSYMKRINSIS
jgi:hypothetical protein